LQNFLALFFNVALGTGQYLYNASNVHKSIAFRQKNWLRDTSSSAMKERPREKLDIFIVNVKRYSQNHKIAFLGHPMRASGAIQALYIKVLMHRNFVAEFHRENASFTCKTAT